MTKARNSKTNYSTAPAMTNKVVAATAAASSNPHILVRLHCRNLCTSANLPGLSEVFAGLKSPSIIGGNTARADAGRFSYWSAQPKEMLEFKTGQHDPFGKLQRALNKYKLEGNYRSNLPKGIFCGGWIGYFSYELGRYIEKLPATAIDDIALPLIRLCFYDRVIAYDHLKDNFWLVALELPDDVEKPEEKLAAMELLIAKSQQNCVPEPAPADLRGIDFSRFRSNMDKDYYLRTIKKIKKYIFDGEVYQINFSQRFECDYDTRPIELYHWQNYYNPSPYSSYIDGGDFHIVSASPEMFITIADGSIRTKPIKGTRPHLDDETESALQAKQINARNFNELLSSEKEQAELNMIIDLERNDVAKICQPGTRSVIQPRTIETYPTVFHAVATIAGQLREEMTVSDILRAMFPGGSITGAPKIRSMEIIDETEPTARNVYTGSIGFIGIDGSVCLNIAIRTIIIKDRKAYAQTGGGIVADSDPEAEWDETITKARALLAGITATQKRRRQIIEIKKISTKSEVLETNSKRIE
jgi:para-aminobenzoate synthetase component 1